MATTASSTSKTKALSSDLLRAVNLASRPLNSAAINPTATAATATAQAQTPQATPANATPYLDAASAYREKARENFAAREQAMKQQLAESEKSTNASYDSSAAGNYINYMRQQNALPEQLARQGIRGGASESAMTRIGNNYALTQGNNNASRAAAIGQLRSTYDTNLANMRQSMEDNILNNDLALQQSQIQYDDTLAQRAAEEARYREEVERAQRERAEDLARDEARYNVEQKWKEKEWDTSRKDKVLEQYAATISRYTNTKSIDAAIKKLQKNKPSNYIQRIWLLRQRRAEILKGR